MMTGNSRLDTSNDTTWNAVTFQRQARQATSLLLTKELQRVLRHIWANASNVFRKYPEPSSPWC